MARTAELAAMRRAIELSTQAVCCTPPNPDVGCVILDSTHHVVGEGWHKKAGEPHAEVVALREAGARARGGTAVITLEPCTHTGRTGPCVDALIESGVARVVYAVKDPHELARGGEAALRAAGIDVEGGVLADAAAAANARWLTPFRLGRPYVVWKFASTLDGKSAAADGSSKWITCAEARVDAHRLRAAVDTIIVGVNTVVTDDPHLTARNKEGAAHPSTQQPLRVVVDSTGRTPSSAHICDSQADTWIATADDVGADESGRVDVAKLMTAVHAKGHRYALLEGGPTLAAAFMKAGFIDQIVGYISPSLLGKGPSAVADIGISTIDDILRFAITDVSRIGEDVKITMTQKVEGT